MEENIQQDLKEIIYYMWWTHEWWPINSTQMQAEDN